MTVKSVTIALVKRVPWESIPLYRKYSEAYKKTQRRKLAMLIAGICVAAVVVTSSILYLV